MNPLLRYLNEEEKLENPELMENKRVFTNIFALGDIAITKCNEEKAVIPINTMAPALAQNIMTLSLNEDET